MAIIADELEGAEAEAVSSVMLADEAGMVAMVPDTCKNISE